MTTRKQTMSDHKQDQRWERDQKALTRGTDLLAWGELLGRVSKTLGGRNETEEQKVEF